MTKNEAIKVIQQLFEDHGWRGDLADGIIDVLTKEVPLTKTCEHAVSDELTRLSYEIPFQKGMVRAGRNADELNSALNQKEAFELVLEISKDIEERKAAAAPSPETVQAFALNLMMSLLDREDVKPHEINRIKKGFEDEVKELAFVECLFGIDTSQYKTVLKEIDEWQKLLDTAVAIKEAS